MQTTQKAWQNDHAQSGARRRNGVSSGNSPANPSRWYDATVGKWLSEDPSGLGPDVNAYRYCSNAPTSNEDPSGLGPFDSALPSAVGPVVTPSSPTAPAGSVSAPIANKPVGLIPYASLPFIPIPSKPKTMNEVGQVTPTNAGRVLAGAGQGIHKVAGLPLAPNSYFGVSGAGPCIGVIVVTPTAVVSFDRRTGRRCTECG